MGFIRKVKRNEEAKKYGLSKAKYFPLKREVLSSLDEEIKKIKQEIKDTKSERKIRKLNEKLKERQHKRILIKVEGLKDEL